MFNKCRWMEQKHRMLHSVPEGFTCFILLSWLLLVVPFMCWREHIQWATFDYSLPIHHSSSWEQGGIYPIGSLKRTIWTRSAQHSPPISFWEWAIHPESEVSCAPQALSLPLTLPRVWWPHPAHMAWHWMSHLPHSGVQVTGPFISHFTLSSNLPSLGNKGRNLVSTFFSVLSFI